MKAKRITAFALAAVTAMSLIACGGGDNQGTQSGSASEQMKDAGILTPNTETGNTTKSDETLNVQLNTYPDYFWHPGAQQSGADAEQIINAAFLDRLVDYDETTGEVVPMLAESWEQNGRNFTFHLRSGVKMYGGAEMTADDVVYTANVWKENCASNDTGKYIDSVTKDDDMTVTIAFNSDAPDILKMLSWANFGIVSQADVEAVGGLEAASMDPKMGSGKYKFKECKSGEYVILERNDDYWDDSYVGYFKEIKFTFINDPSASASAVMAGDADASWNIPIGQASEYASNDKLRTYVYSNGEVEHLFFNMGDGHPTADIKVRQAIDKALNYDAIAAVATAGYGTQSLSYVTKNAPYYVEAYSAEDRAVDIEAAKELLKEAGYDESNPLKITTVTLPDLADIYTVMQENLKEAGIELEIQNVDMGGFVPAMLMDKSYDIVAVGDNLEMRTPQAPQFVMEGMVFGGPNKVLPDHEDILTRLTEAADDAAAKEVLKEYNDKLAEDYMCTNLYDSLKACITGSDIKGLAIRERGYIDVTTMYK